MFQNRINGFVPGLGAGSFSPPILPSVGNAAPQAARNVQSISLADIYQAAMNRAVEEHELDKLFNPDFYDYQI